MSANNAVSSDNAQPATTATAGVVAAMRDAAAKAAEEASSVQEIIDTPSIEYEEARINVRSFHGYQLHWPMLRSLFLAIACMVATPYLTFLFNDTQGSRYSILITLSMIMGEPILSKALVLMDARCFVDFGIGWLSWTLSAIVTAISGTAQLLPKVDIDSKVLNLKSGQSRANNSTLLSRILRDLEKQHAPKTGGLTIEILDATKPIKKQMDTCFILIRTAIWIYLGYKPYHGGKKATYALMRGNGNNHVFIIRNTHKANYNLEDLAGTAMTQHDYVSSLELAVLVTAFFGFSWIALMSMTLSDQCIFCLLAILAVGSIGNMIIVGRPCDPAVLGIPLKSVDVITHNNQVMSALQSLEEKYEGYGESLVKEFFPGGISDSQKAWFADLKEIRQRAAKKAGKQPAIEESSTEVSRTDNEYVITTA